MALTDFEEGPWGRKYPDHWSVLATQLGPDHPVLRLRAGSTENDLYDAIESLNSTLRRSVRAREHFPSDEAATKLIWLKLRKITKDWTMAPKDWHAAKAQFALIFGERFEMDR